MSRLDPDTLLNIREANVRRFGDPTYAHYETIDALVTEVQACWDELRRVRMDNGYIRQHVGNVVGYVLAHRGQHG